MNTYPLGYLFLIPFAVLAAVHLKACFDGSRRFADVSKLFLMPLLLVYYLGAVFTAGARIFWPVIAAHVFSTAGDYFMRDEGDPIRVCAGIAFFLLAQISYIIFGVPLVLWERLPLWLPLAVAAIYAAGFVYSFLFLKAYIKRLKWIVIGYMLSICLMSWFFVMAACSLPSVPSILLAAGSLLFILSDSMLSQKLFVTGFPKERFFVMITYIAAQTLMVIGAANMSALFTG